jgi:hypothetical protein
LLSHSVKVGTYVADQPTALLHSKEGSGNGFGLHQLRTVHTQIPCTFLSCWRLRSCRTAAPCQPPSPPVRSAGRPRGAREGVWLAYSFSKSDLHGAGETPEQERRGKRKALKDLASPRSCQVPGTVGVVDWCASAAVCASKRAAPGWCGERRGDQGTS